MFLRHANDYVVELGMDVFFTSAVKTEKTEKRVNHFKSGFNCTNVLLPVLGLYYTRFRSKKWPTCSKWYFYDVCIHFLSFRATGLHTLE